MKKIILILALTSVMTKPLFASDNEICESMANMAENAMKARQSDLPISVPINLMEEATVGYEEAFKPMREMIEYAYKQPVHRSKEDKVRAVQRFKQQNFDWCLQAARQKQ